MHFDDLPPEIIQRVFRLCCRRVQFKILDGTRISSGTTQVTLSLVCSRWRAITLNTKALWGDVLVYYIAGYPGGPTPLFQLVQNWLIRAGMTPISLYIYVLNASTESEIATISQSLSSSFHITNLELESRQCHHFLLPTNNAYYLERLYFNLNRIVRHNYVFPRLPDMPALKELELCMFPDDFVDVTNIYLIPWHQIRVFTLHCCPWPSQMLLNILQRCKLLAECTLKVNLQEGQHAHDIVLPNLESLDLWMNSAGSADHFIRSLTLPKLRSLHIISYLKTLNTKAILIMAHQSEFKNLTHFLWHQMTTNQPIDVGSLLGSMPALNSVTLSGRLKFQPGTFDGLSSGVIGPQLEEMKFEIISDEDIALLLKAVGQRHEKAKTVSDIKPFASVICRTSGRVLQSQKQQARQYSEAFNARVEIFGKYEG